MNESPHNLLSLDAPTAPPAGYLLRTNKLRSKNVQFLESIACLALRACIFSNVMLQAPDLLQRPHNDPAVAAEIEKLMATFGRDTIKRLPITLKIHSNLLCTARFTARLLYPLLCPSLLLKKKGNKINNSNRSNYSSS